MRISLCPPNFRLIFGFSAVVICGLIIHFNVRAARASAWSHGTVQWQLERAVHLEPANAEYPFKLGRLHQLINQDSDSAQKWFELAVRNNPHSSEYYLALAKACFTNDDRTRMIRALQSALNVDPNTPSTAWEAANLYLAAGYRERALPLIRYAATTSWVYRSAALRLAWQSTHDVDRVISEAIPVDPELYREFFRLLLSKGNLRDADKLWNHIQQLNGPFPANIVFEYFDSLTEQRRPIEAERVWQQLARLSPEAESHQSTNGNFVVNSGFEESLLNGGRDWRVSPQDKITIQTHELDFHSGRRSLLLTFNMVTSGDAGVFQFVPIEPNANYVLSLAFKPLNMEGAHGIAAVVSDAYTGRTLASTEEILGSGAWSTVATPFHTDNDTTLIILHFGRPAGTLLRGELKIDDVRISKE